MAVPYPAQADTSGLRLMVSNTGQGDTGLTPALAGREYTQRFKVGAVDKDFRLRAVGLHLDFGDTPPAYPSGFEVSIRAQDGSTNPTNTLATLSAPGTMADGVNIFRASGDGVALSANTRYHIVVGVKGGPPFSIGHTASNGEDPGQASGWKIPNRSHDRDTGGEWTNTTARKFRIEVYADAEPAVARSTAQDSGASGASSHTPTVWVSQVNCGKDANPGPRAAKKRRHNAIQALANFETYRPPQKDCDEGGGSVTFTLERDNSVGKLTVSLDVSEEGGFHIRGYPTLFRDNPYKTATFNSGANKAKLILPLDDDGLDESSSEITVSIGDGAGYTVDPYKRSASAAVHDNDEPVKPAASVSLQPGGLVILTESPVTTASWIIISRATGGSASLFPVKEPLTVYYQLSYTGPNRLADASLFAVPKSKRVLTKVTRSVTIEEGQHSVGVNFALIDDNVREEKSVITLEILPNPQYSIALREGKVSLDVQDDD